MKLLSDASLLEETRELVKIERQTTARVLEYLSEIDRRVLWLKEGYSSLFDFCVRFLNYSESEAARRIQSARCMARVEEVRPLLEENALSLTGLSMIAPFVTKENAATLIPEVRGKSSREIEKVLHAHFPGSKPAEEFLKVLLDDEMKALLADAQAELLEKNPSIVLKKALRRLLAKPASRKSVPKKHTRYIAVEVKRAVKRVDGSRCAYVSPAGVRCNQTHHLEFDHIRPWAKGGSSDAANVRLLCRAHNRWLGRMAFGPHGHLAREVGAALTRPRALVACTA